jgi:hypothetical protein
MARGDRRIFTVQTPLGHRVFLARDRWRQIIRFKHPALAGYASAEHGHLCVVTMPAGEDEHFVVTAYFTKNIKPGNELWKS